MSKSVPGRKGLEAEIARLRAENERLEAFAKQACRLANRSADMIFALDLESGRLIYVNQRFEELLGYSREQLTGPGFDFLVMIAPDSLEKVRASHAMHQRGEEHLPFEYAMLARGGRRLEVMLNSWLDDLEGRRVVVGVISDISAHHRLAEGLRRANGELERQNVELRALDRLKDGLVRDVSHELKTPVAKQAMQLELLRVQLGEACRGPIQGTIAVMEETVRRQQRVIRNLLDLARLESGRRVARPGPVRVDEALARVLEDYGPTLDAAGFVVTLRAGPLTASADAELLWHVLSNLVGNAVKFAGPAGGRRLELSADREGDRAVVRIADSGIGLSPEEQKRVFERFFQASASVEGSGVGLSICRSIMEEMGGTVTLVSPGRGQGAVATLTLPL